MFIALIFMKVENYLSVKVYSENLKIAQQLWVKQRREGKYKIKKMIIPEAI
jgi:hypothetical protein